MAIDRPALGPDEASRLADFARAFKAAARAVMLYPDGHPAIAATLGRLVDVTAPPSLTRPIRIGVLADGLLVDGMTPPRTESAVAELAALLHAHLIGELTIHPGGDTEGWHRFLRLVARTPEAVRADGGIGRLWATTAGRHVELREIDYAEVMRERPGGRPAVWDQVVTHCLEGGTLELSEEAVRELLAIVGDPGQLAELVEGLDARGAETGRGLGPRTAALVKLLTAIVDAVADSEPASRSCGTWPARSGASRPRCWCHCCRIGLA
jgi:hypothetical protein